MNGIIECILAAMRFELDNVINITNEGITVIASDGTKLMVHLRKGEV